MQYSEPEKLRASATSLVEENKVAQRKLDELKRQIDDESKVSQQKSIEFKAMEQVLKMKQDELHRKNQRVDELHDSRRAMVRTDC